MALVVAEVVAPALVLEGLVVLEEHPEGEGEAVVLVQLQVAQVAQALLELVMSGRGSLTWSLTNWQMSGAGTWKTQPVILVEGRGPFFADHPDDYIDRLQVMHDDPEIARGPFYAMIGQLRDSYEQAWNVLPELEVVP